ncbi:MAG: hypothetical protein M3N47_10265, partial [Chloroflexota bacterium]|nr:hypothetical protein [Chloroflexota bacterium]
MAVCRLVVQQSFVVMPIGREDELHAADYDGLRSLLWLHVQTELRFADDAVPAQELLEATHRDPLPRPDDRWLLWILLLHGLLDKRAIAERHRSEVMRLARARPAAPAPLAAMAERHGLSPAAVLELAAAGDWQRLERLPLAGAVSS